MTQIDPAGGRVLRGVVEQVREDLRDPDDVALGIERVVADVHDEAVLLPVDLRPRRVDGGLDHGGQVDVLLPQRQLVAGDTRDVEQIVDEAREMVDLPLDDVAQLGQLRIRLLPLAQERDRDPHRAERVPQLVRERGQEFVLAPIGVLERGGGDGDVVDVGERPDPPGELAGLRANRQRPARVPSILAVAALELELLRERRAARERRIATLVAPARVPPGGHSPSSPRSNVRWD